MLKSFNFGIDSMKENYKKVKWAIQHPHLVSSIKKSTVIGANSWASAKWGKFMDYRIILGYLGIEIEED